MSWDEAKALVKSTYDGWFDDHAQRLGAALAFYTLLSMAPIVIVVIAIASMAFGTQAAEGRLIWEIQGLVGVEGALAIQGLLKSAHTPGSGALATILGLVTLFIGAGGAVNELREALNTIWHVPPRPASSNFRSLLRLLWERVFSFAMVVGVGFLLLVSLIVNAWLSAAGKFFGNMLPMPEWALQTTYTIISFLVIAILFAIILKILPDQPLEWGDVLPGAAVTALLFSVGKLLNWPLSG